MGNNQVTPVKHATASYGSFIKGIDEETLKKTSPKKLQSLFDDQFSLFLDDFVVNDEQFQKYNNKGKEKCIGALLHVYSSVTFDEKTLFAPPPKFTDALLSAFEDDAEPSKLIRGYLITMFEWNGSQLLKWSGSAWAPCQESEMSINDFVHETGADLNISTFGLTEPSILNGANAITSYLAKVRAAATGDLTEIYSSILEASKESPTDFNKRSDTIPCHGVAINVGECSAASYKLSDHFTVRLAFDPDQSSSSLVTRFVGALQCDKDDLANHLIRWGCSVTRTLTIISGPEKSGKSELVKVAQALYGPYASNGAQHTANAVNYDLVRTCFYDDDSILSDEKAVKSHPCDHLVVVSNTETSFDRFGDRRVKRLVLSEPIDESDRKENISTNLSTRKQLGHLLGWALKHYDVKLFKGSSGSGGLLQSLMLQQLLGGDSSFKGSPGSGGLFESLMLQQLLGGDRGVCGDLNCKGCGGSSDGPSVRVVSMGFDKSNNSESMKTTD